MAEVVNCPRQRGIENVFQLTMRLLTRLFSLFLFITLAASGWGSVLAAAFCPHAQEKSDKSKPAAAMAEDHACCRVKFAARGEEAHCSSESKPEVMSHAETPAETSSGAEAEANAPLVQNENPNCAHCLSRPNSLPAPFNRHGKNQTVRASDIAAPTATYDFAAHQTAFTRRILARQGAPPGTLTRTHILNSIFLI